MGGLLNNVPELVSANDLGVEYLNLQGLKPRSFAALGGMGSTSGMPEGMP
jgi:hypothetical protein